MSFADDYRTNAEDCLRIATAAVEERDRPLWATMAQSWLRLAEYAERLAPATEIASEEVGIETDHVDCVALAPEEIAETSHEDEDEEITVSPRATN